MPNLLGPVTVIKSAGLFCLGNGSSNAVSMIAVQLVSASFSGTITVKARLGTDEADAVTPVPVLYVGRYVNGTIGADGLQSDGLTGNSLILIPASGQTIYLDTTGAYTSGAMTVHKLALFGAVA